MFHPLPGETLISLPQRSVGKKGSHFFSHSRQRKVLFSSFFFPCVFEFFPNDLTLLIFPDRGSICLCTTSDMWCAAGLVVEVRGFSPREQQFLSLPPIAPRPRSHPLRDSSPASSVSCVCLCDFGWFWLSFSFSTLWLPF